MRCNPLSITSQIGIHRVEESHRLMAAGKRKTILNAGLKALLAGVSAEGTRHVHIRIGGTTG